MNSSGVVRRCARAGVFGLRLGLRLGATFGATFGAKCGPKSGATFSPRVGPSYGLMFALTLALLLGFAPHLALALPTGPTGAPVLDARAALYLPPDGRAQALRRFTPAGSPLQRHSARPGAWYALLYLPMGPQWPMQLQLWSTAHGHGLRLLALDAAPEDAPTVALPLPADSEASRTGRPPRWTSRFTLPANSTAPGVFVLIEQWRSDGEPPAPLWVQFTSQPPARATAPWWPLRQPRAAADGDAVPGAPALYSPPSPLTRQAAEGRGFEVPIYQLPPAADTGVWR